MEAASVVREEGCASCKQVSMGSFCTACGRQVKPVSEGTFAFRAAEGSAEKAWKSFGFADAHASSKRARAAMIGNDSAKRAASLALAATRNNIEKTVAPPTLEQARVMGVESVVEGIDWNLSTDQLQVLALARSGALRGRRRVSPSALPQTPPATSKTAATTKTAAPKRRVAKGKPRDAGSNLKRHESSVDRTYTGSEQQGQGSSTQRSSGRRGSGVSPKRRQPAGTLPPPKNGGQSSTTTSPGLELGETQEQLVAVARGGVRYAGKVFHRRGVKLTKDSPRSMLPRDAFRASGPHLLGQRELSMGRNGHRRVFLAELSAVVRAIPVDTARAVGLVKENPPLRRSQPPSGAHLAESSFVCGGVRLEMRPLPWRCQALDGECALDALNTTCSEHANQLSSCIASVGAAAEETVAAFRDAIRGSGSSGSTLEERKPHRGAEEDGTAHAGERLLQLPPSLADLQHNGSAGSAGGWCHQRSVPVVFSQDFTHVELDALLGATLRWKDPFEEDRTVGGLEANWIARLDSLCARLRAIVPGMDFCGEEADGGKLPGEGEGVIISEDAIGTTAVVAGKLGTFPGSIDGSPGTTEGIHQKQCAQEGLAANTDVEGQGSPAVPVAADGAVKKTGDLTGCAVGKGCEETQRRAVRVLPLVRRRKAWGGKLEEEAREGVWFDKTILRVGARVPWGRLHRGRFAKVLFTVTLGKGGNGLEFAATSNSPTADPMLRGRWDCRVTDRDLARYLSSGYAAVNGANRRVRPHTYDPQRCAAELQERGELEWACSVLARTAFRLVIVVPGGVVLSLAGVTIMGGREVAWPQDIEEDRVLCKASSNIQRAWRGYTSRKRARWLRMEREGRRRLSRMRKEAENERERTRLVEQEARAKLVLEEERRTRAQIVLAAATRGQVARWEISRQLDQEAAAEREEAEKAAAAAARAPLSRGDEETGQANETTVSESVVDDGHEDDTTPGVARLERVVTIDGTEVHLTAHVKGAVGGGGVEINGQPMEMLLVAVDKKARRSSRLSLDAADIGKIIGARQAGKEGGDVKKGAKGALSVVLQKLTLFNSRRKDLFILSYRGKKVIAPH